MRWLTRHFGDLSLISLQSLQSTMNVPDANPMGEDEEQETIDYRRIPNTTN